MKTVKNENEEGNKMKKTGLFQKVRKNRIMLLMLLPAIAYTVIFSYIPMTGIVLAFKKYNYHDGIYGSPWVGLKNFDYMIVSDKLWSLTRNTLLYNIAFIVLGIVFEVGFAIMLSEINNRIFKKVSQTVMFLPYFIPVYFQKHTAPHTPISDSDTPARTAAVSPLSSGTLSLSPHKGTGHSLSRSPTP